MVSFPRILQLVRYPVPGFPVVAHSSGRLREHFMYQNKLSQVAVVQEVNKPLPCCNFCGVHIPVGRLIKNSWTAQCDKNTQIRWQRRDVAIAENFKGGNFSLTGEDGAECVEGVDYFKYLGRILHQVEEG